MLVSSHTAEATYENEEVVMAVNQVRREGARLVPVRMHADAELPYGTGALQALDCFDEEATAWVAEALVAVLRAPPAATTVKPTQLWCGRVPALPVVFAGLP